MSTPPDFENRICTFFWNKEKEYAEIIFKALYLDDLEACQDLFDYMGSVLGEQKILLLANGEYLKGTSRDFRKVAERELPQYTVALALSTTNHLARIAGNLFLKFSKLPFPSKLFKDREKALEWLAEYKN